MTVLWEYAPCIQVEIGDVSNVYTAFIIRAIIALMIKALCISETSINLYETTRSRIPEDCHLNNRRM
jgi:hypothetical protein